MNNQADVLEQIIMQRRSIRTYKNQPVDRKTLDRILDCGINAPNGMNWQAYEIRVIDNKQLLDQFTAAVLQDNPEVAQREGFKNIFVDAPTVLFIAKSDKYELSSVDCGLLAQNIMLSAQSLGIGSCCLGSSARWLKSSPSAKACLDKLNFSPGHELFFCIALGYPDQEKPAKPRRKDMIQYIEQ